ncbi:hypothetical protein BGZ70_006145 [Mortierella alpina]|uniref:Uncharacterized protein n=1 Tax=Mortierella alpina TaxID=64518 RepID=A0A9P6JE87_MORAP|nr:hypothetical protein BGZ70_006145 [Mortierella alpina]
MQLSPSSNNKQHTSDGSAKNTSGSSRKDPIRTTDAPAPARAPITIDRTPLADRQSKSRSGSGAIPITMDVYQQLRLERQEQARRKQEQEEQQQPRKDPSASIVQDQSNAPQAPQQQDGNVLPSLRTVEQIASIVQATAPAIAPMLSQPQQAQIPGPNLASIIFGQAPPVSTGAASTKAGAGAANGNALSGHGQQRRSTGGAITGSQSQARTASPPTPVSGPPSSAQRSVNSRGPKAIHAIELIRIAGEILQLPPATIGTSLVYYHKYRAYLHQANKRGERDSEASKADEYLFATACLHLACKCTEVSRKVRDLVNVTYRVMNPSQPALSLSTKADDMPPSITRPPTSGSNSQQQQHTYPIAPPPTAATYWHIRDSLLTTELMLLRILQFDLDVSLPFGDVLRIYKGMGMVFSPTDEEAAQLYPHASNFDVFLPAVQQSQHPSPAASSPNKHGTPSSSSSSSSGPALTSAAPHTGIHPTLSALVQISTTFCIDALCNSNIALNSSSRALAMGSIYLAIRSAGLELPLPFQEWCYAWGPTTIASSFGIQTGPGQVVGMGLGVGAGVSSANGIMGLTGGTNNLFVSSPRPAGPVTAKDDSAAFMDGVEMSGSGSGNNNSFAGANGLPTRDSVYSQTHSPVGHSQNSPTVLASLDGALDGAAAQQPVSIVDEVRRVVQELGSFYTR